MAFLIGASFAVCELEASEMSMLVVILGSAAILSIAYLTYGPILVRLLKSAGSSSEDARV